MSDAALDASADALAHRILRDLPADRPRTRADLDRVPAPVARLLHARLDAQAEHAAAFPASPWVDAESDGVREATRTWLSAIREAARFPADVWAPAVEQASRLALSHLVWPAETLAAYAFEGEGETLPTADALRRLQAFGVYPYLPEIAGRYVETKGLERIDRAGLERLLRRIDRRMVSAFGADEWMTLLGPFVDLVGLLGDPQGTIPTALLRPLFQAKDAEALAHHVEDTSTVSASELRSRIASTLAPAAPDPATAAGAPAPPSEEPDPATDAPAPSEIAPDDRVESDPPEADPVPEAVGPLPMVPVDAPPSPDAEAPLPDPAPPEAIPAEADAEAAFWTSRPAPLPPPDEVAPPPVIGSRYNDPADAPVYDSDVLGDARVVEPASEPALGAEPEGPSIIFPHLGVGAAGSALTPLGFAANAPLDAPDLPEPHALDTTEPSAPEADEAEPLWQRLARERGPVETPAPPDAPQDDADADETPLWMRFVRPGDGPAAEAPSPEAAEPRPAGARSLGALEADVLGLDATDERRAWFIEELFDGSADDYERTLAALAACRSYTEATQVVEREVFRAHRVNPFTDASVAFIDALQDRFTARGRG